MIAVDGAANSITADVLEDAKVQWHQEFSHIQQPITAVMIGGNAKGVRFNRAAASKLYTYLKSIANQHDTFFVLLSSRRTPIESEHYLRGLLKDLPHLFFTASTKPSPYMAALAYAESVIVTGESVSMLSEAASLPINTGVYIFAPQEFTAKRYQPFHQQLIKEGYANSIEDFSLGLKRQKQLNVTDVIANRITAIIRQYL